MSAHTPGPWKLVEGGWIDAPEDGFCVVQYAGCGTHHADWDEADLALVLAAPELLAAQTMGAQMNTPDFLEWIADRLVNVHGENPNVDYIHTLRDRAKAGRAAMLKATGGQP